MPETLTTSGPLDRESASQRASDGRLPIVLGVTGHRAIRAGDEDAIVAHLRALLLRLQRECPHSPLLLLTSLAEGADRLAARVALDAGVRLIAVLPLSKERYARDFASPESQHDFHALLDDPRTERCIVVPLLDAFVDAPEDARNVQYLLAGLFIARHSDVLIALWDGGEARGTGGTAQIVAFRQTGRLDVSPDVYAALVASPDPFRVIDAPLDAPQTGLVYHVPLARTDDIHTPGRSPAWLIPPRHDATARARDRFLARSMATLRHRDSFNRESARVRASHENRLDLARAQLTRGELTAPPELDGLRESFALADALAVVHQKSIYRTVVALFVLVAIATVSMFLRSLAVTDDARRLYLAGYLLLLAVADAAYLRTRWRGSQDRFQDYRALAEGLRVQFFWRLAGSARAAADYYLRRQRTELRWIRDALRSCALRSAAPSRGDVEAVQRLWVQDQREYYRRAGGRDGRLRRRERTIGSALLLLSVCAAVAWLWRVSAGAAAFLTIAAAAAIVLAAHVAYEIVSAITDADAGEGVVRALFVSIASSVGIALALYAAVVWGGPLIALRVPRLALGGSAVDWLLTAVGITALAGTFVHAYANVRAFGEHQKQYERMEELFRTALDALSRYSSLGAAGRQSIDRILVNLGCEALAEHADWLLLHRARPIELPTAEL